MTTDQEKRGKRRKAIVQAILFTVVGSLFTLLSMGRALSPNEDSRRILGYLGVVAGLGFVLFAWWEVVLTFRVQRGGSAAGLPSQDPAALAADVGKGNRAEPGAAADGGRNPGSS